MCVCVCVTSDAAKGLLELIGPPLPPTGVSPSPTTLLDRYSSPPASTARRRLFVDPVDSEPGLASSGSASTAVAKPTQASLVTAIPAGQTVVTMATATVTANNGQTVTIPVQGEGQKTRARR